MLHEVLIELVDGIGEDWKQADDDDDHIDWFHHGSVESEYKHYAKYSIIAEKGNRPKRRDSSCFFTDFRMKAQMDFSKD